MKCVICRHGETRPGKGTATLVRSDVTVVFNDVPMLICENCGEQYTDGTVTEHLLRTAEEAARSGVQVEVRHYVAA